MPRTTSHRQFGRRPFAQTIVFVACSLGLVTEATEPIRASRPRKIDSEVGFAILVWQYKTDAMNDAGLYDSVGLTGWHIDRGRGKKQRADWGLVNRRPFYIDHAAGKGILHLTPSSGLNTIAKDGTPSMRPHSFFQAPTLQELKDQLDENLPEVVNSATVAIALDDEVSLGTINSPLEVDYSTESLTTFQGWLRKNHVSQQALQVAWPDADPTGYQPVPYESVRQQIASLPPRKWRLAPWMDFRTFQDESFSNAIAEATRHAITLAKGTPVGVVGAQQPSAYGGFDYSRLRHAMQFIEAYDIGGTNEILHSFWNTLPRKPRMQTFFASGNVSVDRWFLWYYLAHGNRGVIAWPAVNGKPWFEDGQVHASVQTLKETFQQVQAPELRDLSHPLTKAIHDPVAILVSQPSIRLGWAIDATAHGKTWPRRLSSLDNACLNSGKNRVAWLRLLEDIGIQARCVDESDLVNGLLKQTKTRVLILPQSYAMDRKTCDAILRFARDGGLVIADHAPAITDEHGTGYRNPPLDLLFGIEGLLSAADPWFDGKRRYEIDGERVNLPFPERIEDAGCLMDHGQPLIRRDVGKSWSLHQSDLGRAGLINQSPTRLFDAEVRSGAIGTRWREQLTVLLQSAGVDPVIQTSRGDDRKDGMECLRYQTQTPTEQIWCWVANPTRQASVNGAGRTARVDHELIPLTVTVNDSIMSRIVSIRDLRTHEDLPVKFPIQRNLAGDEAMVWRVRLKD